MQGILTARNFVESLLRLTRFWNLLIIAFAQYFTAAFLVGRSTLLDARLAILCFSTMAIAAGGYVINDYYDVKIDYINKPERVIIGKSITRRYAILFHVILSFTGILAGLLLSLKIALVNGLSVFLLWFYSNNLKRQPGVGNVTVAILTGLAILIVDLLYNTQSPMIWIYAGFAFFMTLIREIIKDIEDLKGDNTFGCRTLPIVLGIRKTKFLLFGILLTFAAIVLLLHFYFTALPLKYFLIILFIPLVLLSYWLIGADTKKDFSALSSFCKLIMLLGISSMAFV